MSHFYSTSIHGIALLSTLSSHHQTLLHLTLPLLLIPPTIQLSYIFIFIISLLGFFFILFYIHFSVLFLHVFFFSSFDFKASTWVDVLTAEEVGRTLRRSDLDKLLEILEVIPMGIVASQQQV